MKCLNMELNKTDNFENKNNKNKNILYQNIKKSKYSTIINIIILYIFNIVTVCFQYT